MGVMAKVTFGCFRLMAVIVFSGDESKCYRFQDIMSYLVPAILMWQELEFQP